MTGNRAGETYTYRKVDWQTWQEGADLGNVTGGSIELGAFTDLKATCSFAFQGGEAPEQDSLVRIYYSFTDEDGNMEQYALGTFIVCYSQVTQTDDRVSGTCDGYSVLKVLNDRKYGMPYTVSAGAYPIAEAVSLITSLGLRAHKGDDSTYQLTSDHTFEPDDSYLTIVNWLLTAAGFAAVTPDASGVCQIQRPSAHGVAFAFDAGEYSIMYPSVQTENDWQSTPNVVRAYYEDDTCAIYAVAKNATGSKASLDRRGDRELTLYESVSEVDGADATAKLANLVTYATGKLTDNSGEIERVTISHPYVPLLPNQAVTVDYGALSWQGNITNMRISLAPSTKCDTETRRLSAPEITVTTESGILWEVSE